MPLTRTAVIWTLSAVAAGAVLVTGGAVWALTSGPAAPNHAGSAASSTAAPGAVPPLYTGDELAWLLLPNEKLTSMLHAVDFDDVRASWGSVGESEGRSTQPKECFGVVMSPAASIVGARSVAWRDSAGDSGSMLVMQFASPEQATNWAAATTDLLPACAEFTNWNWGGTSPYSTIALSSPTEASADLAHVVVFDESNSRQDQYNTNMLRGLMVHGNVVVQVRVPHRGALDIDQKALADALLAQAGAAHQKLAKALG